MRKFHRLIALAFASHIGCAQAEEGETSGLGSLAEDLAKAVFPGSDAGLLGATTTAGTTTYYFLSKKRTSLKDRMDVIRQYRDIGLNQTQFRALKAGDRVILFSEDVDELNKVADNLSKLKGQFLFKLEEKERVWRFTGTITPRIDPYGTTKFELETGAPRRNAFAELEAEELQAKQPTGWLSDETAQAAARFSGRLGEDSPLLRQASRSVTLLRPASRAIEVVTIVLIIYEAYRLYRSFNTPSPFIIGPSIHHQHDDVQTNSGVREAPRNNSVAAIEGSGDSGVAFLGLDNPLSAPLYAESFVVGPPAASK